MKPQVSIIVPHYNDQDRLQLCLAALAAQRTRRGYEIVVGDNGSDAPVTGALAAAPMARCAHAPTPGAGPARNAAVAASEGGVLAFTDADCVPAPDWLEAGLNALTSPGVDVVGGGIDISVRDEGRVSPTEAFERVYGFRQRDYVERKHFSATANMFASREVFDRVGGFRQGVAEDKDWGERAHAMGFSMIYCDAARVSHPARAAFSDLCRKWDRLVFEQWELMRGKPGFALKWPVQIALTAASPFIHVVRAMFSPDLAPRRADASFMRTLDRRFGAARVLFQSRFRRVILMISLYFGRIPQGCFTPRHYKSPQSESLSGAPSANGACRAED